jgi:KaiC/GvpD/RAD55 family RecA-like ATPase
LIQMERKRGEADGTRESSIPPEIEQFLTQDTCSLLIKGGSGTGKTSLALSILNHLEAKDRFLYLSTRTSTGHFLEYYPWLRDWLGIPELKGKAKVDPAPQLPKEFIDARLDEPIQLFERITNELMDVRGSVIVIDTWDSLREFDETESLSADMRVLQAWCERARSKLIVTKEDPLDGTLDSVVDGVVTLKQWEIEGRRARELGIVKLHGIDISNPSYLFTLEGGRFHSFPHYSEDTYFALASDPRVSWTAKPAQGSFSTGYRELDTLLGGGLSPKTVVNVELGSGVHAKTGFILLSGIITGWTRSGRRALVFPFQGLDEEFTDFIVKNSISANRRKLVTQVWPSKDHNGKEEARSAKNRGVNEWLRSMLGDGDDAAVLAIVGAGHLDGKAGHSSQLEDFVSVIRSSSGLGVIVTRQSDRSLAHELSIGGALHVRIEMIRGTLLLQPERPSFRFLATEVKVSPESATVELQQLV